MVYGYLVNLQLICFLNFSFYVDGVLEIVIRLFM